ncbi:secreted RxLR effector protein 161-like [Malus domestica]|uniref:secreted RxLR effector protein 161-like n=1 Tax=Malus domestica TaxID=3750 RepID=UPI0039766EDB
MSDLGLLHYFLGIEVSQTKNGIFISQKKYAKSLLKKFNLSNCKTVATPLMPNEKMKKYDGAKKVDATKYQSLIGSLLYLTVTRPDIMFASSMLSRYMEEPSQLHFGAGKRVLRYVQGTLDYGIMAETRSLRLIGYTDSDWAGCLDDMKSTSAYLFSLGSGICSWRTKKQNVVAQSSTEAEYVAVTKVASQVIWLRRILKDI